ncbi:hypothetical protein evm_011857 [Chilo suppressalis]|nr:hypothetical protein evm_011857 [Chilo suppressalis]
MPGWITTIYYKAGVEFVCRNGDQNSFTQTRSPEHGAAFFHACTLKFLIFIQYRGLFWLMGRNSKLSVDNKLLIYKVILKLIWMYGIQL